MENASQALIIAGTILIAMIVLSIGVYLVSTYSQVSESYENTQVLTEITKFNANFTKFENRTDITAQEIVTLYNFKEEYKNSNGVDVTIQGVSIGTSQQKFLIDNSDKTYSCINNPIEYGNDGRVKSIKFKEN